jgi:hypothetical protein
MHGFETILPFLRPIEHLILDDSVSEVMVNGPDRVFIERNGFVQHVPGISLSERALTVAVKNIARRLGDDISEAKPILDSRLPDGSRVAAVMPPCSLNGVTLTIRKFNSRHFEIEDLIRSGTLDRALANRLEDTSSSDAISCYPAAQVREKRHYLPHSENSFRQTSGFCSSKTPPRSNWRTRISSGLKRAANRMAHPPFPSAICSKPPYAIVPIEFWSERSGAARPSNFCNF